MANVLLSGVLANLRPNHWMVSGFAWTTLYPASRNWAMSVSLSGLATSWTRRASFAVGGVSYGLRDGRMGYRPSRLAIAFELKV